MVTWRKSVLDIERSERAFGDAMVVKWFLILVADGS